jgi:MYXO-CTERM domain-containing protein
MAVCGPIADAIGLHATLRWMSAVGIVSALIWLAQPAVRALRRPEVVEESPAPEPVEQPIEQPAGWGWFAWVVAAGLAAAFLGSRRRPS